MKYTCAIFLVWLCLVLGRSVNKFCQREEIFITCKCIDNADFNFLINLFDDRTFLTITSCATANLHFSSQNTKVIRDISIKNTSDKLTPAPLTTSRKMSEFNLQNIGRIALIGHDTFASISQINTFTIENTKIDRFEEQFMDINILNFILQNVTIERMAGLNFAGNGEILRIINCIIRNIGGNLNFVFFESIEIINSTFEYTKPGDMSIEGVSAKIIDCVFSNVSMNLVARGNIVIKNNCADGKSSLRLSSIAVNSYGNKIPTEIIYTQNRNNSILYRNVNNTVCIAGNCKCPKSTGHNSHHRFHGNIYLGIALLVILHGLQSILDCSN